jgi:hypothetical protein
VLALVAAAMRVSKVVGVGVVVEGRFVPIDVDIEGRVVVLLLEMLVIMVMMILMVEMATGVLVGRLMVSLAMIGIVVDVAEV